MLDIAVTEGLFITWDFVVLIVAATALGFLAHKTYQPNLIAYLVAGIFLGPVFLGVVSEGSLIELVSEIGLALLLFLLGLELKFESIKNVLKPVLRIGTLQISIQAVFSAFLAYFLGFRGVEILVISLATIYASTAVVVKTLVDKGEAATLPGKIDVGVLLIQDIFVVVVLTLLSSPNLSGPVPIALNFFKVMGILVVFSAFSYTVSRYLVPKIVEEIGKNKHILLINGAAWAFLFIAVSSYLNVSIEVGAFIAGLGLAQTPFSDEMKEQMRPLTDFFIVLFFTSIGLQLTRESLLAYWKEALISSAVLMPASFLVMFWLIDREKFSVETSFKGSINMTQCSEFALVVGAVSVSSGLVGEGILGYLSLTVVITMAVSAYLIKFNDQLYRRLKPYTEFLESEEKKDVEMKTMENHAIIVGYNEITRRLVPVLKERYGDVIVIDKNPEYVELLRESEAEFVFGDLRHGEMRKSVGLERAGIIVSLAVDEAANRRIIDGSKRGALVFLRAKDREEAAELYDLGADFVIIKRMLSAEKMTEYIEAFLEDTDTFDDMIEGDKQIIDWEARL
ncbi:MAG: cation:proton antiporter [Candidatus Aenigmatarchaeota archaeon]